jgi:hypothetical protein
MEESETSEQSASNPPPMEPAVDANSTSAGPGDAGSQGIAVPSAHPTTASAAVAPVAAADS